MANAFFQPQYNEAAWGKYDLRSWHVFKKLKNAKKAFPNLPIIGYKKGDIEDPVFVDERFTASGKFIQPDASDLPCEGPIHVPGFNPPIPNLRRGSVRKRLKKFLAKNNKKA